MEKHTDFWNRICARLAEMLSPEVMERWIKVIQPVSLSENRFDLAVANGFYQSWLEDNYLPLIRDTALSLSGDPLEITLTVNHALKTDIPSESETRITESPAPVKAKKAQTTGTALNPKYTFDTFISGSSNSFAHAAGMAVAQSPSKA